MLAIAIAECLCILNQNPCRTVAMVTFRCGADKRNVLPTDASVAKGRTWKRNSRIAASLRSRLVYLDVGWPLPPRKKRIKILTDSRTISKILRPQTQVSRFARLRWVPFTGQEPSRAGSEGSACRRDAAARLPRPCKMKGDAPAPP